MISLIDLLRYATWASSNAFSSMHSSEMCHSRATTVWKNRNVSNEVFAFFHCIQKLPHSHTLWESFSKYYGPFQWFCTSNIWKGMPISKFTNSAICVGCAYSLTSGTVLSNSLFSIYLTSHLLSCFNLLSLKTYLLCIGL